jgi:ATP/maltotriose-dependent transcriptional regulator MalT
VPVDPAALAALGMADVELVAVTANNSLGTAAFWAGDHAAADRHLRAAVHQDLPALALSQLNATAYRTLLICERGELAEARRSALEVVSTASESGLQRTAQVVAAYLTMARVALDRNDDGEVDEWLGRVAEVESVAPEPHVRLAAALLLAARRETAGDRELALLGLRTTTAQLGGWDPPHGLKDQLLSTRARLLTRSGDHAAARRLVRELGTPTTAGAVLASARLSLLLGDGSAAAAARNRIDPASHPRARVDTAVLDALLADAAGNEEGAQGHLEDALVAAAPSGMRWTFLADAAQLRPLLERRRERGTLSPRSRSTSWGGWPAGRAPTPRPSGRTSTHSPNVSGPSCATSRDRRPPARSPRSSSSRSTR